MTLSVTVDQIDTLELEEEYGRVRRVVRRAIVSGITDTDYNALFSALNASGLPETWADLDSTNGAGLVLNSRKIKMIDLDKAEVIMNYSFYNDPGQSLGAGSGISNYAIAGRMATSITQKKTSTYREDGIGDEEEISVQHTYPSSDPDYADQTVVQTGEIMVTEPQKTFTVEGIKQTSKPWTIEDRLINAVNNSVWLGKAAHTWMCTEVTWHHYGGDYYNMSFTFQYDKDTWDPRVTFIDDRTKRPPLDLVADEGYKNIAYHREVDFVTELGFFVTGPAQ